MTSPDTADLRVGDRITVLPGKAKSGHTYQILTRGFAIEVTYARRAHNGDIEAEGILLTTRGGWRNGVPTRSVILPAGSYTAPIRVGDTVRYPHTGETPVVTAIHERPDGTALADLLFRSGATGSGVHLVELEHLGRPAVRPAEQPCKRRHDPALPCNRCVEASEPVTTGCDGPLCRQPADHLVVWSPPSGAPQVRALCQPHREAFTARQRDGAMRAVPLAAGTYTYVAHGTGTQVATCRHCGHAIYLYAALASQPEPWRAGEYDQTGRCPVGEERTATRVVHEPATTIAERDYARAAATCTTTADLHPLGDCPARRSCPRGGPVTRLGLPQPSRRTRVITTSTDITAVDGELPAVLDQQRLPHPNPHTCAHCTTNRATLRLTLATGEQVTICRPHASRYPR